MNFRGLKIFLMVCETRNMTETGERLHMTQPAVSKTIIDLEEELNAKLFERIKNKLILTYAGEVLFRYSKKMLHLLEETEDVIGQITSMKKGKLRIGASMTIGTYLLPELLKKFNNRYKNIEISLVIDNTDQIAEKILNNQIDIGLIEGPVYSQDIIIKPYYDDKLCLICSIEDDWAEKKQLELAELKLDNLIIREEGSGTREIVKNILFKHNIPFTVKHILNNFEAIKKAVIAGIGVSFLSEIAICSEVKEGKLKIVKINDLNLVRKFNIIYHKDKFHTELFKQFINFLETTSIKQ